MLSQIDTSHPLRVLNFGCGTGFESDQLLQNINTQHIKQLTCYDPSAAMVAICQSKIGDRIKNSYFLTDLDTTAEYQPYNLLLTNSVCHHLPLGFETIHEIVPLLTDDAIRIAGHEPSDSFYTNPVCQKAIVKYEKELRWRRWLKPGNYWRRLKRMLAIEVNPWEQTARISYEKGYFKTQPTIQVVDRLIDVHVSHATNPSQANLGFDIDTIQASLTDEWKLIWTTSYSFMGIYFEGDLSPRWAKIAAELKQKYPKDGANFASMWRRK